MENAPHPHPKRRRPATSAAIALLIAGGSAAAASAAPRIATESLYPVTSNATPYSRCLTALASQPGDNLPVIAVGDVADKTGQLSVNDRGYALSQGAAEMVMSAFYKTHKARLVERLDLRAPNQELTFRKGGLVGEPLKTGAVRGADFIVTGALTELNYNIVSDGLGFWFKGIGGGGKRVVINVALDLRLIDARTLEVVYVSSLQKQIVGHEVEANVFRFFNTTLIELDAGRIRNEPLQLGVRSVAEMAVHQMMTDHLGLAASPECRLVEDGATALPTSTASH